MSGVSIAHRHGTRAFFEVNRVVSQAFVRTDRVFDEWSQSVASGAPPIMYPVADPRSSLSRMEIGPGLVTLLGGAPGAGKTAFVMQLVVDGMVLTRTLRVLVCNVEMPWEVLLSRQLARFSGIDLRTIRYRQFREEHHWRLEHGFDRIGHVANRLAFLQPPFDMGRILRVANDFRADLIVLDYIQRIPSTGESGDRRGKVDANMESVRELAGSGKAVIVVAAVSRTRNGSGRKPYSSGGLGIASFRESSELEYGADDAYILAPSEPNDGTMILKHVKSRHSELLDHRLEFHGAVQQFTSVDDEGFEDDPSDEPELDADREVTVSTSMLRLERGGQS